MSALATEATARLCLVGLTWLPALAGQNAADTGALADGMRAVLERLDAAFGRGDADGYAALFEPDHLGAHALLRRQLERCFAPATQWQRSTTVVGELRRVGEHTAVRVRHDVTLRGDPRSILPQAHFTEDWLIALRPGAQGVWVPTLAIETTPGRRGVPELFRCPPCNYEIGGVPGWLCVPLRSDRANAMEAASFYLLGSDVACDVSVQVDPGRSDPAEVATQLADALFRLEPGARPGSSRPWLPPAHAAAPPPGLRGAVVAIELPHDFGGAGGRALFHVAALGGLQHLLLLRGSARALRERAATVDALLHSYRLVDPDFDAAAAAPKALAHHTGGAVDGETYRNERYGVELRGAPGWRPTMRAGGAAFRVVWTSAHGSRLWLTGFAVPPGMSRWCRATATRWIEQQCDRRGLQLAAAAGDAAWTDDEACRGASRVLIGTPRTGDGAHPRWFRVALNDDLLLVLDGFAVHADDEPALQQMLHALRRH